MQEPGNATLFSPITLACGAVLKNRLVKSAMSDSLGDGRGEPTAEQIRLYERWAEGGVAASIIGEVQGNPKYAEKPGNLVLAPDSDLDRFRSLARRGTVGGAQLWLQLGHAGAMAHPPISTPKGPSRLDLPGLSCDALSVDEIERIPAEFARTAGLGRSLGFSGVEIHAAHGFLLSQFLSPLFNQRGDAYGGSIENRMRLLLRVVDAVRETVGTGFPVVVKLNATDQLPGGLDEGDAMRVIAALEHAPVDVVDISGGTYFPGAKPSSEGQQSGPYFLDFAERARAVTSKALMVTGGFKTREHAEEALERGVDLIGLARALVLDPTLPRAWQHDSPEALSFPRFTERPEGGVTAWYTMRIADLANDAVHASREGVREALERYEERDGARAVLWNERFSD